jgi:hypothetical protein
MVKGGLSKMNEDRKFYVDSLLSVVCQCERDKKRAYSFCYQCYNKLPLEMQRNLYCKMGDGYEEAYDMAVQYLSEL